VHFRQSWRRQYYWGNTFNRRREKVPLADFGVKGTMKKGTIYNGLLFLADQARKTYKQPSRIFFIVTNLLRHWYALPQIGKPLPIHKIRSSSGDHSDLGELQLNNCYLDRNPSSELIELAARHAERGLENFVLDANFLERQNLLLAKRLRDFFQNTNTYRDIELDEICDNISIYRKIYLTAPITRNIYGLNFASGLCLFVMARCLRPQLIVESGVYKGLSSYILASACPTATIHVFDPDLTQLAFRMSDVHYHQHDWMSGEIICSSNGTALGFFDDHQSQAMRVIQAHERGFRHLIFDDSWPIEVITGCGWPPLPSIDMIMDNTPALRETITWAEGSQKWTYTHTEELRALCSSARKLIKAAHDVPSLYRECGVAPKSALKFVELV
jgi:hypothetical protein